MSVRPDLEAPLIICPYNPAHRLKRQRLQQHLLKCRLQHPDMVMKKCPFDQTHVIPELELEMHVLNCPGRRLITLYKYNAVDENDEERPAQPIINSDENWDDSEAVDYNPQKYAEQKSVLRCPDSFQPSERKAFCKQERKLLDEDSGEEDVMWTAAVKKERCSDKDSGEKDVMLTAAVKEERCSDEDGRPPTPPPPKWPTSKDRSRSPSCDVSPPTCSANNTKRREAAAYDLDGDPYYNNGIDNSSDDYTQINDDKRTSSGRRKRSRSAQHVHPTRRFHHDTEHN